MPALLETSADALAPLIGGTGRARTVWKALRRGDDPLLSPSLSPRVRQKLAATTTRTVLDVTQRRQAADGTSKFLLVLHDGHAIEMVSMSGRDRTTLCVSTQVGCAHRCAFCVTGTLGLRRNLSAAEIVAQVHRAVAAVRDAGAAPLRNVVFMGMGEPLDNLPAVTLACRLLTDPHGMALAPRHLTLSTVGTSPKAIREAARAEVHLAWSLHAAEDGLRRQLVPGARHTTAELRDAFVLTRRPGDHLFVEIALIAGVNDSLACADAVVELLRPLHDRARVNLLPANRGMPGCEPSSSERVQSYQQRLRTAGLFCMVRRARGVELDAACGQLAARLP
ncbi:MAG: 23S rRNA (adenine(2503)-C(2))-methyltransferase RlmN [Pseudomonadota bacterium]